MIRDDEIDEFLIPEQQRQVVPTAAPSPELFSLMQRFGESEQAAGREDELADLMRRYQEVSTRTVEPNIRQKIGSVISNAFAAYSGRPEPNQANVLREQLTQQKLAELAGLRDQMANRRANMNMEADRAIQREQSDLMKERFKHQVDQDAAELAERRREKDAYLEYLKTRKRGGGGGGGTLTKQGDISIEIPVPSRDEFFGTDAEYATLKSLAASKSPKDRDRAFKLIDQSSDRQGKFAPNPEKLAELDAADRILGSLGSQVSASGEAPPGLGGSIPERMVNTNLGLGMVDKGVQALGSAFLTPQGQKNISDFQQVVNTHIKRMAGSGVSASEADRVMKGFGTNVPWTDPSVRVKLIEAMQKDNENLRKLMTGNPYTRGQKAATIRFFVPGMGNVEGTEEDFKEASKEVKGVKRL